MEHMQEVERLEKAVETASALATKARLEFDALAEMYSEEKKELLKNSSLEKQQLLEHCAKESEKKDKIISWLLKLLFSVILCWAILLGGVIGVGAYLLQNFDVGVFSQEISSTNGDSIINDGIAVNKTE